MNYHEMRSQYKEKEETDCQETFQKIRQLLVASEKVGYNREETTLQVR